MGRYFFDEPVWLSDAPRIRALEGDERLIKDWKPIRILRLRVESKGSCVALRDENRGRYLTELSIYRLLCGGSVKALDISNDAEPDDW